MPFHSVGHDGPSPAFSRAMVLTLGPIRGEGGGGGDGEGWGGMSLHDHRRVVGVVVVTLLPGVQRHLGDGDGVAGHQRVAANTNAIKR